MHHQQLISCKFGALAGVAFVLLLFFSVAMVDVPAGATDAELTEWWSEDANLTGVVASTYLQIGAGMCLLVFLTVLRAASLRAEGGSGALGTLAFVAGVSFVAVLLASDGPRGVIAIGAKLRDEPLPSADMLRYMPQVGHVMMGTAGGVAAGVAIAASSLLVLRTGLFGRWLGILGMVCATGIVVLALIVGPFFIPVLLIWVLATSVALWRAPDPGTANVAAAPQGPMGALMQ